MCCFATRFALIMDPRSTVHLQVGSVINVTTILRWYGQEEKEWFKLLGVHP